MAVLALASVTAHAAPVRHQPMSVEQVERAAREANRQVIVVFEDGHKGSLDTSAQVKSRAATQRRQRASVVADIGAAGGTVNKQFTTLNGVAATVSAETQAALEDDPSVAAVIPDELVPVPDTGADQSGATALGLLPPVSEIPATPSTQACPSDPSKPLLEPEALQSMRVAYTDPTTPQAQSLARGKGVKVAFFGEGIDIDNPDFIRPDGSRVIVDYQDFTGVGTNTPTSGAEAFGDASAIAAQGRQVYDLSTYVHPSRAVPAGCNITVRGVAPDASLVAMKVFPPTGGTPTSVLLQAIDYAVTVAHVDVLSESFGGLRLPDGANDALKRINRAAVDAGVAVVLSSGDAGNNVPPGTPGNDDPVIGLGATTNFRSYAQAGAAAFQFSNGSYLSDNMASLSNAGVAQNGNTIDVVAPGAFGWAVCTPNVTLYSRCTNFRGGAGSLLLFGGTSQSAPLTAGVVALMIEAYRNTHGGATPSPATLESLIQSTANDLGYPSVQQGAGLVDGFRAVQAAMSINGGTPTGNGLQLSPAKLNFTGAVGSRSAQTVKVTNIGAAEQVVSASSRALTETLSDVRQDVTIPADAPTYINNTGLARPYATTKFTVPASADRLVADAAWPGTANIGVTLIDPSGAFANYSSPQGTGSHGEVDVRKPRAGTWTAILTRLSAVIPSVVHLQFATQRFVDADKVTPASLTLAPGASGTFTVETQLEQAGDDTHDLVISSGGEQTVVPIVRRTLVSIDEQAGGTFTGTVIGGNGRENRAQENTYSFDVPEGRKALNVRLDFNSPGTEIMGVLVDPDGNQKGYASSSVRHPTVAAGTLYPGLVAGTLEPAPGRWKFVVWVRSPVGGQVINAPFTGKISFQPRPITASGIPNGARLEAGKPVTVNVRVTNDGPSAEHLYIDARTNTMETIALSTYTAMPYTLNGSADFYVPTHTDSVQAVVTADKPVLFTLYAGQVTTGDPNIASTGTGNTATASYSAPKSVPSGLWWVNTTVKGPFTAASTVRATAGMTAHTRGFDLTVDAPTGRLNYGYVNLSEPYATPLTLLPGESGTIPVTFTPQGAPGTKVSGTLYVSDFNQRTYTDNEQFAVPYSYTIAGAPYDTNEPGTVGGNVPATLALTLGAPAQFGAFTPGVMKTYLASTTANVTSSAGDALLSVADPSSVGTGHLVNGTFVMPQPLQARARNATNTGTAFNNVGSSASPLNLLSWAAPVSNDAVSLDLSQLVNANDPLRTGTYAKALTFTLSTTTP